MGNLFKDVRYGARALARRPGFALVAVLTLALGIGANTSIFSGVNAILLRPLPGVSEPERLALVYPTDAQGRLSGTFSYGHFREYRAEAKSFDGLAAFAGTGLTLRGAGERAEHVAAQLVSGDYFPVLGVRAGRGRTFAAAEDEEAAPVIVLSHRFWERRFGADPSVVGRQLVLGERAFTVAGVAAKEFHGTSLPKSPALWMPLRSAAAAGIRSADLGSDRSNWLQVIGRVKEGVGHGQARAELDALLARRADSYPEEFREGLRMELVPARGTLLIDGAKPQPYAGVEVSRGYVGARYFETMGIAVLRGRGFEEQDREGAPPVAVVNETIARRVFGDADPVGRRIRTDSEGPPVEIVGVVGDSKYGSLADERVPFLYLPLAQNYSAAATLLVRTEGDPAGVAPSVRGAVESLDAEALSGQATMGEHLAAALVPSQVAAGLFGIFGLLALLLATFGVYGVTAYSVSRRTHEIGVRMALGARAPDVLRLVLGEGMALVAAGLAAGLLVALAATRAVEGALYGVSATDPATFAGVTLLLACAALLACLVPARRATKVDPMTALRYE